jgi:hypothetical protein
MSVYSKVVMMVEMKGDMKVVMMGFRLVERLVVSSVDL